MNNNLPQLRKNVCVACVSFSAISYAVKSKLHNFSAVLRNFRRITPLAKSFENSTVNKENSTVSKENSTVVAPTDGF